VAPRILILSASIGEGHDAPARELAAGILQLQPDAEVEIADGLGAMGRASVVLADTGSTKVFLRFGLIFDASYALLARIGPTRWALKWLTYALGARGLTQFIAERRPDAVVATHPGVNEALAGLRRRGRLRVPLVSAVTDLAALHYWVSPGVDLHLLTEAESLPEVLAIAPDAPAVVVRGLCSPAFDTPRDPGEARAALDVPSDGPLIVVSGGGWAVGDLAGAAGAALGADPLATVLVLCGRSDEVRSALAARFAGESRLRPMGFTDRMGDVLGAADVLIHSTAGLTVFEARIRGARVISYGWGRAHIRVNNRAYRRLGLAQVVDDQADLPAAIARAMAAPRRPLLEYGSRPSAAAQVLALLPVPATAEGAAA
jgi:UDP-N-acetylglucosamine:LPS N-acetylglucosamine transferase